MSPSLLDLPYKRLAASPPQISFSFPTPLLLSCVIHFSLGSLGGHVVLFSTLLYHRLPHSFTPVSLQYPHSHRTALHSVPSVFPSDISLCIETSPVPCSFIPTMCCLCTYSHLPLLCQGPVTMHAEAKSLFHTIPHEQDHLAVPFHAGGGINPLLHVDETLCASSFRMRCKQRSK